MFNRLFLTSLTLFATLFGGTPAVGNQWLVKLYYNNKTQLAAWEQQGIDLTEKVTDEYVEALLTDEQRQSFLDQGVKVETIQEDFQVLAAPSCYKDYPTLKAYLEQEVANYPNLATLVDVGDAWEKTQGGANRDLWAVKITSPQTSNPKPKILLVGMHHAREVASSEVLARLVNYLLGWYGIDSTVTSLLDTREVWVLPMLNPDGREKVTQGLSSWRKNTNPANGCQSGSFGIDLNRNYQKGWGGASTNPCGETYQGPSFFSESETQGSRNFFQNQPFNLVLSIHSYSEMIIYPWGYTTVAAPHRAQLDALAQKFAQLTKLSSSDYSYQYGQVSHLLYIATGGEVDWFYDQNAASFVFEIGQTFYPSCATFEANIWPKVLKPFIYAIQVADAPYGNLPNPLPVNPNDPATVTPSLTPTGIVPTPTVTVTPSISITPTVSPTPLPTPPAFDADLNDDSKIDSQDMQILITDFLRTPPLQNPQSDINRDGAVNGIDASLLILLWSP